MINSNKIVILYFILIRPYFSAHILSVLKLALCFAMIFVIKLEYPLGNYGNIKNL